MDGKESLEVVTCKGCAMFVFLPELNMAYTCNKCKLLALLEEKVRGLEQQVSTLRRIREDEEFLDRTVELQQQQEAHEIEEQLPVEAEVEYAEGRKANEEETLWKRVTVRSRRTRRHSALVEPLELSNRFQLLEDETKEQLAEEGVQETPCNSEQEAVGRSTKKKRRVVVVGDSLLRGIETHVCREDPWNRQVCCLPGAQIRDVTEGLPKLIKPTDTYPFLLIHVGTNDVAKRSYEEIISDFEALGRKLKNFGAQVVFSSILPVLGRGLERERKILRMNDWLRRWCRRESFGFWDHGLRYLEHGLLARDGLHLTRAGKNVFGHSVKNLIRRALN